MAETFGPAGQAERNRRPQNEDTPMADLILHHYEISAFSERVRLAMGLKGLTYRSVLVPPLMPKPDLTALTGGYRRAPVLQVGADIYCDSLMILRTLDRLHPEPSLAPGGMQAIATPLAWWIDKSLFMPALGVVGNVNAGKIPPEFVTERKAFGFNLDPADIGPLLPLQRDQAAVHLDWLAAMLADGRPFLLGDRPCLADLAAHCPVWLLRTQGRAAAEALLPLTRLEGWYARVCAIGHGIPLPLSSADALAIARDAEPVAPDVAGTAGDLRTGERVTVTPDDTGRDPVAGELLAADAQTIVIRRTDPELGRLNLHYPRAGYDVAPA